MTDAPRELEHRLSDGIEVRLLWHPRTNRLTVEVVDASGASFELNAPPDRALDVFRHPYAYAAFDGMPYTPRTREPVEA